MLERNQNLFYTSKFKQFLTSWNKDKKINVQLMLIDIIK